MSLSSLLTHSCTITRRGTRTSDAGDTVETGVWDVKVAERVPCFAQQLSGTTSPVNARERRSSGWRVLLDGSYPVTVLPRDRVIVTIAGTTHTLTVIEVRPVSDPVRVHHIRLEAEEVIG